MIGIFDSGLGGLTVARAIVDKLPDYDIIYFGDTARTPYGNKSKETVIQYSIENTEFLIKNGAKIIVIACNTASSVATDVLRKKFNIPIFEVISPAVEMTLSLSNLKIIGVIGTRATINSGIYNNMIKSIKPDIKVYSAECPLLVPLVEEGWIKKRETRMIVKKYLHPLKTKKIDTLILGCTHYPILKNIIKPKIGRKVRIIDSSLAVANKLSQYFIDNDIIPNNTGNNHIFVSDITPHFKDIAKSVFQKNIDLKQVKQ